MSPPLTDQRTQLPPKENALFKRVVRCYEHKLYRNGLKFANKILNNPKFSEHGETLAMKGLILNCQGRKEEAYELVRRGLRADLRSHVCWHVFGLLQRADRHYDEAIKAYRNALKWDKENIQILRDLSLLQIQVRDLEGFRETRYQLFQLRPTQRASWIGFAMAHHLLQDYSTALNALEEFRKTQIVKQYDYEYSELLLYQNQVLCEAGRIEEALEHLQDAERDIGDRLRVMEVKADLLCRIGRKNEASKIYRNLINRNPENTKYYHLLERCMDFKDDDCNNCADSSSRLNLYQEICSKYPSATVPQRLPLNFLSGSAFAAHLESYLRNAFRKSLPALFVSLRKLYVDREKVQQIESTVLEFELQLEKRKRFSDNDSVDQAPSVLLWVWYFLSRHFDYLNKPDKALHYLQCACDHTPTLIELYVARAKIYKHAGAFMTAVGWMDEAQSLDTADRFLNSKCAKYMLRANLINQAEEMCSKFTREGMNPQDNLNEMQCMWWQISCAQAFKNLARYGDALKHCHQIAKHFDEIIEDQYDFHTYCVRKMTLSSYIALLRFEDTLRDHIFYYRAARCAIKIYLRLHNKPYSASNSNAVESASENCAEVKKQRNKERKAQRKAQIHSAQQKAQQEKAQQHMRKKLGMDSNKDADDEENVKQEQPQFDPQQLVRTERPLEEALKFFIPLLLLKCDQVDGFTLGFEIFYHRKKPLLMLQCLIRAHQIDATYSRLHVCFVKFLLFINKYTFAPPVQELITEVLQTLLTTLDPYELNKQFRMSNARSLVHLLAVADAMCILDSNQLAVATQMLTQWSVADFDSLNWRSCLAVLKWLRQIVADDGSTVAIDDIDAFTAKCADLFPICEFFNEKAIADGPKVNSIDDGIAFVDREE